MNNKNRFESGSLKGKMKEVVSISVFALISAVVSILLSDLIFFPLTYYSISNVDIFNILFKYIVFSGFVLFLSSLLFFKVRYLYREGKSVGSILFYIFLRPFQYSGFVIFTIFLITAIIVIIYILHSFNFYHLHRISGGV